jgi:hypothetical protein
MTDSPSLAGRRAPPAPMRQRTQQPHWACWSRLVMAVCMQKQKFSNLRTSASAKGPGDRFTPLIAAAHRASLQLVKCLCLNGADVYDTTVEFSSLYLRSIQSASELGSDAREGRLTAADVALGCYAKAVPARTLESLPVLVTGPAGLRGRPGGPADHNAAHYMAVAEFLFEQADRPRRLLAAWRRLAWSIAALLQLWTRRSLSNENLVTWHSEVDSVEEQQEGAYSPEGYNSVHRLVTLEVVATVGDCVQAESSTEVAHRILRRFAHCSRSHCVQAPIRTVPH